MSYVLILQWPGSSEADFDDLIAMEEQVDTALGPCGSVDGHDFGSGEMNIFIETLRPTQAFEVAAAALVKTPKWRDVRAAYRDATGGPYRILWPKRLQEFSVR